VGRESAYSISHCMSHSKFTVIHTGSLLGGREEVPGWGPVSQPHPGCVWQRGKQGFLMLLDQETGNGGG
jgi:hypothetical protein